MENAVIIIAAVLTVSDTRKPSNDVSGAKVAELLVMTGATVVDEVIVSDDSEEISRAIVRLSDRPDLNLIISTGGTGFGPRDNTPEATLAVLERQAPGIAEAIRRETHAVTPTAMLSRGVAGIRNATLIINLPGSPKAVEECFEIIKPILRHAIDLISGHTKH